MSKITIEKNLRPFLLTMPDKRFWPVDEQVGNAWKDDVKFSETIIVQATDNWYNYSIIGAATEE